MIYVVFSPSHLHPRIPSHPTNFPSLPPEGPPSLTYSCPHPRPLLLKPPFTHHKNRPRVLKVVTGLFPHFSDVPVEEVSIVEHDENPVTRVCVAG